MLTGGGIVVERRDIEIFLTLADELHFGRTAERLQVSVARVSQAIKKLERRIGVPLFERTSRQVGLTPIGRRLYDDMRPAHQQIEEAIERAIVAGRGVHGVLRVGFVGAAAGQLVLEVAEVFQARHPECEVQIRENQFADAVDGLLRAGEIEMLLAAFPMREPDLTASPVLFREARMLAVSAQHPFARRASISFDDLARDKVLRSPPAIPDYWDESLAPRHTADGRPAERGPVFSTIQEMLALVGAGKGVYPIPTQASQYYIRPDVAYVPIHDAPPFEWGFIWPTAAETNRIRAFDQTARDVVRTSGNPLFSLAPGQPQPH
jgi:DNA-binding transcriptional LysR family regulator